MVLSQFEERRTKRIWHLDAVISNQVFEHVANKHEAMLEIRRVLKTEGFVVHCLPSKWRVIEPHIFVPLVSWMWPAVPYWWLALWAILGVRNEFQRGKGWREVAANNRDYCRQGLDYRSKSRLKALLVSVHGTFVDHSLRRQAIGGGWKRDLLRRVPFTQRAFFAVKGTLWEHWIGSGLAAAVTKRRLSGAPRQPVVSLAFIDWRPCF